MPVYEYECMDCGCVVEVVQRISDMPLELCGLCSGRLNRLISQSSFHLKGSGWYVTDYKNQQGKKVVCPGDVSSAGDEKGPGK